MAEVCGAAEVFEVAVFVVVAAAAAAAVVVVAAGVGAAAVAVDAAAAAEADAVESSVAGSASNRCPALPVLSNDPCLQRMRVPARHSS